MLQSPGSKHELGLRARLEIGASDRERQMLGCGWMVCSAEDGLGVVSGSSDAEGLFRRCPTRNPSIDEDTELLGHRSSYAAASSQRG